MAKMYAYRAKDRTGQTLTGSILAENEAAVATHIREKDCFVLQIKVEGNKDLKQLWENMQSVRTRDLAVLCRQFSTMINAGVSLVSCLNILIEQTENSPRLKRALQDVYKNVKEGEALARSMAVHDRVFPGIMINMIEAGEVGGVLDEVLERLASHFEKEHKLNERVKSAMTYPCVVISLAILALIFIMTFILPTFIQMFEGMRIEIPMPTRVLLFLSDILRNYWLFLLVGLFSMVIAVKASLRRPKYKKILDEGLLRIPVFGMLARKIAIARFSRTLSTLIKGGVSLIAALEVVKKTIGNLNMISALTRAQTGVKEGQGLSNMLAASGVFTPMVIQMVAIGEESGALDDMLEKVADFYENEVDDMVSRLSSILEPFIILVLGLAIGFIIISVMLPVFDVITGANKL